MRKKYRLPLWMGPMAVLLMVNRQKAQAQSASISGIVTDASGGVIPNARVELLNESTDVKLATVSNRVGLYALPTVQPGNYQLTIAAPGFETERRTHILVEVSAKLALDVHLKIGAASDQVVVDGSGESINTTDASVSTVIGHQFVAIAVRAKAANIAVAVVQVPSRGQAALLSSGSWARVMIRTKSTRIYEILFVRNAGIYLDILPAYRSVPGVEEGFYPVDGHPNASGHTFIASLIAQQLTSGTIPQLDPGKTAPGKRK